ncbi:solute carrier family 28 member 3-like [Chrysoperla carnea]|uniref:solute carrier family 28 member 3-like n=1 Tax=Chrysoperla carnea TaxID=189513 RepID=UPI001D092835|nr:solute carrier family 28 member 3-like [Chrysoperla carnea]
MEGHVNQNFIDDTQTDNLHEIKLQSKSYPEQFSIESNGKATNGTQSNGIYANFKEMYGSNKSKFHLFYHIVLHLVLLLYFIFATIHFVRSDSDSLDWANGFGLLILLYVFGYTLFLYNLSSKFWQTFFTKISSCFNSNERRSSTFQVLNYVLTGIFLVGFLVFLFFDTAEERYRLKCLIGLGAFLVIGFVFSKHHKKIRWRPVVTGLFLQVLFGILTIRWTVGRNVFQVFGDKVTQFLNYTSYGAEFIYGGPLVHGLGDDFPQVFAFATLPTIFFISFMVNILYYYGIMQAIVTRLGWALGSVMGTSTCESVNSAANIFLGMTESPLLLKPYLQNLTKSELFSVMTSGFATVAGTVLQAYISFGAEPSHLITASLMSAPAALCFSKLIYPETEKRKATQETIVIEETDDTSAIDAATKGANGGIAIVLGIIANVIAFVAFVAFLNETVCWFGERVGFKDVTFQYIVAQIFTPISWIMGVDWDECEHVGNLIALKTVVNEFAAYKELGEMKKKGLLNARSEMIATYAVCGFANPGSIGIMVGGLTTLIPKSRETIAELAIRAFISGAIVCFMTACIAGVLIDGREFVKPNY